MQAPLLYTHSAGLRWPTWDRCTVAHVVPLLGAVAQRIDVSPSAVSFETRLPGETVQLVLAQTPAGPRLFALSASERKALWGSARLPGASRLEGKLEGARLTAASSTELCVRTESASFRFRFKGPKLAREPAESPESRGAPAEPDLAALRAGAVELATSLSSRALEAHRADARVALRKAMARVGKRVLAIDGDLGRIAEVQALAAQAPWLLAEAGRARRGQKTLVATDWSTGEPRELTFPLDPARPAQEQLTALFRRAKRMEEGKRIAILRRKAASDAQDALGYALLALDEAGDLPAIDAVLAEAKAAAPKDFRGVGAAAARTEAQRSLPYRIFLGAEGAQIFVGKGAKQNDVLTFRVARSFDLWLHAKDRGGAHVIVPRNRGQETPSEVLVDAAHLAAHFSLARGETVVDVQYVSRGHLRKPRKSAPGFVVVEREKVLVLRVSEPRIHALLSREET